MDEIYFDNNENPFANYTNGYPADKLNEFWLLCPNVIANSKSGSSIMNFNEIHKLELPIDERVTRISQRQKVVGALNRAGASAEVKIEASWGDKRETNVNVGVSGEIRDNKGNYIRGEASQDRKGDGNVSISAGIKKEGKN